MELAKRASYQSKGIAETFELQGSGNKLIASFVGGLLCAIAFNGFLIPNQLLSGGAGGIAIMLHYLTDLPTSILVFLLNIPIFILGAKMIDKKFVFYSFISMITMSFLLDVTQNIYQYIRIDDILIESILGGVLNGLGMGIMFRNKTSQGGMDIIAAIFKKKFNINIGTALMGVNLVIIGASSLLFGLRPAMYTIIALYIAYQIVDKVQLGLDAKKSVIIISSKPQEMADAIIKKLQRGATFLQGEGAYSKDNKKIIYCTVTSTQIGKLKDLVEEVDSKAFFTINGAEEVKGKGFRSVGI